MSLNTKDPFGRLMPSEQPDMEIADIKDPTALSGPVGAFGKNKRRDVAKVETILADVGALDIDKTDGPTGYWGMRMDDATRKFQKANGLKVDAQVNPGGETVTRLAETRDAAKRRKERREEQTEGTDEKNCPRGTYLTNHRICIPKTGLCIDNWICEPYPSGGGIRG